MLRSLLHSNPGCVFTVYLLHTDIRDNALNDTESILAFPHRLINIQAADLGIDAFPVTSRYPLEMYYRIFAVKYLPNHLDRILYLDPDIVVTGSLVSLYQTDMGNCLFAASTHIGKSLHRFNRMRLNMERDALYVNSGVMLMNLKLLRREQEFDHVFAYMGTYKNRLLLPDQDIISALYGDRVLPLDPYIYNMTESLYRRHSIGRKKRTLQDVRENCAIIHYCGRNKPWKPHYRGKLNVFYCETVSRPY